MIEKGSKLRTTRPEYMKRAYAVTVVKMGSDTVASIWSLFDPSPSPLLDGTEGSCQRTELTLVMITTSLVRNNSVKTRGLPRGAFIPSKFNIIDWELYVLFKQQTFSNRAPCSRDEHVKSMRYGRGLGRGGGDTLQSLKRGGSAPSFNPLPFCIPFWQKR